MSIDDKIRQLSDDGYSPMEIVAQMVRNGEVAAALTAPGDECRACGVSIVQAPDGAWQDDSGACGCGVQEHEPGGFNIYAARQLARDTPWYDDPKEG